MVRSGDVAMTDGDRLSLLFAREPEQELEVDDEPDRPRATGSPAPGKPPTSRVLVWALLLVLLAGGTYLVLEPDTVMRWLGQEDAVSPPMSQPRPAAIPPVIPTPPPDVRPTPPPALPPASIPTPAFAEGQTVLLASTGSAPGGVPLGMDSTGSNPGPVIASGSTVTVLDADWQHAGWVYHVRTEDGRKGWIAETHLAPMP